MSESKRSRETSHPYDCIRCGYNTLYRNDMRRHFNKKKTCATTKNNIELTDAIKEHILNYRLYHIPKQPNQKIVNNTINSFNTMNNFLSNIDGIEKLKKMHAYKLVTPNNFEDELESKYSRTVKVLDQDKGDHCITHDDIRSTVDSVSKVYDKATYKDMNIYLDNATQKLMIYECGDWQEKLINNGLRHIITLIQDYYWHRYEAYLIRKINISKLHFTEKQHFHSLLRQYYSFLAAMDIDPFVKDRNDNQIKYNNDDDEYFETSNFQNADEYSMAERHMKDYVDIKSSLSERDKRHWRVDLINIVNSNSKKNMKDLNKMLTSIINMDEEFKNHMLESVAQPSVT